MSIRGGYSPVNRHRRGGAGLWLIAVVLVACNSAAETTTAGAEPTSSTSATTSTTSAVGTTSSTVSARFGVLVFHRTEGFRHASIAAGIEAVRQIGQEHHFEVVASQDPAIFSEPELAGFDVVVFLSTSGDILDAAEETTLRGFVESGGGFVGVHAAADTEYEWAWYGELVGAYFAGHPEPQEATLHVVDPAHPIVEGMPATFDRFDEWYDFGSLPGADVELLVTIDEASYQGGTMGDPHPISWAHDNLGGRSFYTAMGHTEESFTDPLFLTHLANGILWVAGGE